VLPILALGDDPRVRALAEGLTEELMTALGEIAGVRVASRTAVTAARQETPDLRELGARLSLGGVLEGTVRVAGGRLRLSVRLVDVTDGCQRWVERWDVSEDEVSGGEEALAREVAHRFRSRTEGA
jgi:TolB-like protein